MTLAELRAEVKARGQDNIDPTFIDRWINNSYQSINDRYPWPFLETTTSGAAPLTINDFAHALSVVDTTSKGPIVWEDLRTIRDIDPTLAATGSPECWYFDGSQLKVWPVNTTDTISVRYIKVPTTLTADGDTPLLPARFHYLLAEGACGWAYQRAAKTDMAADYFARFEEGIELMCNSLMVPNFDSSPTLTPSLYSTSTDW